MKALWDFRTFHRRLEDDVTRRARGIDVQL